MNDLILELNKKYNTTLNKYGVDTQLKRVHFFSQMYHESKLTPISENLNYSAKGLLATFPKYFKTLEQAKEYERQPEKIASYVYASRFGNGDADSGDGWRYRGRGFIQTTFKGNYQALANFLKNPEIVENPDLLLDEPTAIVAALYYWMANKINSVITSDNEKSIVSVTKKINGGTNGLAHRKQLFVEVSKLKLV